MTIEELQAQLQELNDEKTAILSKNRELLSEVKKLKTKQSDVDIEAHLKLQEDFDALKADYDKVSKTSKSEIEKLSKAVKDKDSVLSKMLIEDELTNSLVKAGVKNEFLDATKALLRTQAQLKNEGDNYTALIGDKTISDYVTEWAGNGGKHFVSATTNSGGGSTGGSSNAPATTKKRSEMTHSEKGKFISEFGQDAYFKLPN